MKRAGAILIFYALIAFLALYNVLFHSGSHIPGQGVTDYYHFTWSYWWVDHALTTPDTLYETNYVIYPYTSNLAYHTLALFWFPLYALAKPLVGALAAFNILSFTAFTLTGACTYLLLRRWGVSYGLALLGGVILEITPLMFMATWWTTPNLMGLFWYPLHLLLWGEVVRHAASWRGWAWAGIQGIAFWLAALTDIQYLLFLSLLLVPYGVFTLVYPPHELKSLSIHGEGFRVRLILSGILALLIFSALMWWAGPLQPMLDFDRSKTVAAEGGLVWGIPFPEGFLRVGDYPHFNAVGGFITLITLLTLFFYLIPKSPIHKRRGDLKQVPWLWGIAMLLPFTLSLGREITIAGTTLKLPYAWLHEVLGGTFRAPGRFGAVFVLAALLFCSLAWTPFFQRGRQKWLIPPLLWLVLAHHLAPIPVQPAPPSYQFYEMMGREKYDYIVLEVPVAVGDAIATVGKPDELMPQYYGAIHGKRMVTGHLSRAYLEYFWYLRTDDPALSWLGGRRALEPALVEPELRDLIQNYPIGYVVLHQASIGLETLTNPEIIGYFNSLPALFCPPIVEGTALAYRTTWHPDGCPARTPPQPDPKTYFIDIGASGDEKFLGWGWYWAEKNLPWRWMGAYPTAKLYVEVPLDAYQVEIAAQAFWEPRRLQLAVNGVPLETVTVTTEGLNSFIFTAPAAGQHLTLEFIYDEPTTPAAVGQSADTRPLAIAVDWVRLTAR